MGRNIFATGPIGSGHAVEALNNYVSAAGLAAACRRRSSRRKFGIDPGVLVDVLNVSTGKNNSTDLKMKPFVLSGSFSFRLRDGADGEGPGHGGRPGARAGRQGRARTPLPGNGPMLCPS